MLPFRTLAGRMSPQVVILTRKGAPMISKLVGNFCRYAVPVTVVVAVQLALIVPAMAQDPVKVDPKHYQVAFENDQVRVLRIKYGVHEKSVMHQHPANVAVFLTDAHAKFTFPDGKTRIADVKQGDVKWDDGGKHLPENIGDKPMEVIVVELKNRKAQAAD